MIEALGPGVDSPVLQVDKPVAESTPKAGLAVAANATGIGRGIQDLRFRDIMTFLQMLVEGLSAGNTPWHRHRQLSLHRSAKFRYKNI